MLWGSDSCQVVDPLARAPSNLGPWGMVAVVGFCIPFRPTLYFATVFIFDIYRFPAGCPPMPLIERKLCTTKANLIRASISTSDRVPRGERMPIPGTLSEIFQLVPSPRLDPASHPPIVSTPFPRATAGVCARLVVPIYPNERRTGRRWLDTAGLPVSAWRCFAS